VSGELLDDRFWGELWAVLTFRAGHNTAVVMRGTMLLGGACGVVGTFLLLRQRALIADALAHAALPGVCLGFLAALALGVEARSLSVLLPAAALCGLLGLACVQALTTLPRVREDAAIGVVLSVFFAGGVVLLSVIQNLAGGGQAGLNHFIFGQAATMRAADAALIGWMSLALVLAPVICFKELRLLCFDAAFARALGWPTLALDALLLALVTAVTVAGLSAVGAILMVALLIIPAAAARFWTDRLGLMAAIAAGLGAAGCYLGAAVSATLDHVPTGPAIVIACSTGFAASLLAAPRRGVLPALLRRARVAARIDREHLLRAAYESAELAAAGPAEHSPVIPLAALVARRRWSADQARRAARRAVRRGDLVLRGGGWALTETGRARAERIIRAHRLWEHYVAASAGVAGNHLDRAADDIEHFIDESRLRELERAIQPRGMPESIHRLGDAAESVDTPAGGPP
jgi:manganese/zinc/iron transport system permease protein